MSLYIRQVIGNPGNPCWELIIEEDEENICFKVVDVDSKEELGVAMSPAETLVFIEALQLMFKVQQSNWSLINE